MPLMTAASSEFPTAMCEPLPEESEGPSECQEGLGPDSWKESSVWPLSLSMVFDIDAFGNMDGYCGPRENSKGARKPSANFLLFEALEPMCRASVVVTQECMQGDQTAGSALEYM